jgi:hypothetical protein
VLKRLRRNLARYTAMIDAGDADGEEREGSATLDPAARQPVGSRDLDVE